ncbi:unnamed protein product [Adineta ricciae]|uniref:WW domain-containing protein n=1 Tax=Adineta ricciae TaxID=249248 RepID=A0A814P4C0_ADIRI|nr:unnamed protein product [Adineta ricciae]
MHDSKHRTTDTQIYDTRKDGSGYSSNKREWHLQSHGFDDETSNNRKYMRTQSSSNNRVVSNSSSSQQHRQNDDKKAVRDTKKPLRVFGDWSEFKSSTGKTYFYNCKTEISQWESPKCWPSDESNRTSTSSTSRNKKGDFSLSINHINCLFFPNKCLEPTAHVSATIRTRHKVEDSTSQRTLSHTSKPKLTPENSTNHHHHHHQNGNHVAHDTNEQSSLPSQNRLASPDDDSSRMSFSSASSKQSSPIRTNTNETNGNVLHSSLSEPAISVTMPLSDVSSIKPISINGNDTKHAVARPTSSTQSNTDSIQKNETESNTSLVSKAEREQEIQKYYRAELIQHLTDWPVTQLEKQCLKLFDDYYAYSAKTSTSFTELKACKSNYRVLEIKRNILTQKLLCCQKQAQEREES